MSDQYVNDTIFKQFDIDQLPESLLPSFGYPLKNNATIEEIKLNEMLRLRGGLWDFGYSPNNSELINEVMSKVGDSVNLNVYGIDFESNEIFFFFFLLNYN